MVIKESSDELNPPVVAPASATIATPTRSYKDYLALAIATCGVGYLPLAPGTWGSLVGVCIYFAVQSLTFWLIRAFAPLQDIAPFSPWSVFVAAQLLLITIITLVGIWAASRAEKLLARKDPRKVVIDEVAGQLIAFLPIVRFLDPGWLTIISAFLLFRLFDIIKPYPVRQLESLESGLGIMADDVVAGAYAAVLVSIVAIVRVIA
ncbi:MAG: phosphatidylglycerophosphatase A family protein [Pyrinomonadaceae bacterium]